MIFLLGSALIFGGLLGLRYRLNSLIIALPIAFFVPCGLMLIMGAGALKALASAFLAVAAVQLGFFAGGLAASEPDEKPSASLFPSSSSHWRRRGV